MKFIYTQTLVKSAMIYQRVIALKKEELDLKM